MSEPTENAMQGVPGLPTISESQRHRVLANECRRVLLKELEGHTDPVTLETLTSKIIAREDGNGEQSASDRLPILLHHAHLPLLDELGIVDYDSEDKIIEPRRAAVDGIAH